MEAFLQLWQRPPAHAENLGGWLYRVATRLGLNRLRSAARRDRYELDAAREGLLGERPATRKARPRAGRSGPGCAACWRKWMNARPACCCCAIPGFHTRKSPRRWT